MNLSAILHRCAYTDCYAFDENSLEINIRTAGDIEAVLLVWCDSANHRKIEDGSWRGGRVQMKKRFCLKNHIIWNCSIEPPFKRAEYYFEIFGKNENGVEEKILFFENDFALPEQYCSRPDAFHKFKMAWMNSADIIRVPDWVKDTVWYQIMPDRFCSAGSHEKRFKNRDWEDDLEMHWADFYGGDLAGIIEKLDYLKELGISGIYFTPVLKSCSNHKYNIEDYEQIDPDFGSEEEMKELVRLAHERGIRIMVDAVFNHSGSDFPFWLDVLENGENSRYKDWFFVNEFPLDRNDRTDTSDGRYFSFDFVRNMPKLNTNNPEVQEYFTNVCRRWVNEWNVDGIRFDVGNEVSHSFVKKLRDTLCKEKSDLFLLGEIWTDSIQWLGGDEYHSVMNYPFMNAIEKFFSNLGDFSQEMAKVYSLYYRQTNYVLFNFIDTHDTDRAVNSCRSMEEFYQKLVLLMTMQGTPCIFYGTEIALEGAGGPYNRRPMPWSEFDSDGRSLIFSRVKEIISIRNSCKSARAEKIEFIHCEEDRQVHYFRFADDGTERLRICINSSSVPMKVSLEEKEKVIFSINTVSSGNKYTSAPGDNNLSSSSDHVVETGGILVARI